MDGAEQEEHPVKPKPTEPMKRGVALASILSMREIRLMEGITRMVESMDQIAGKIMKPSKVPKLTKLKKLEHFVTKLDKNYILLPSHRML